nr:MAG TPA: hypothetical protein [Caudoviricetes sp.]
MQILHMHRGCCDWKYAICTGRAIGSPCKNRRGTMCSGTGL